MLPHRPSGRLNKLATNENFSTVWPALSFMCLRFCLVWIILADALWCLMIIFICVSWLDFAWFVRPQEWSWSRIGWSVGVRRAVPHTTGSWVTAQQVCKMACWQLPGVAELGGDFPECLQSRDPCSTQLLPGLASNAVKPLGSEKVGPAKLLWKQERTYRWCLVQPQTFLDRDVGETWAEGTQSVWRESEFAPSM